MPVTRAAPQMRMLRDVLRGPSMRALSAWALFSAALAGRLLFPSTQIHLFKNSGRVDRRSAVARAGGVMAVALLRAAQARPVRVGNHRFPAALPKPARKRYDFGAFCKNDAGILLSLYGASMGMSSTSEKLKLLISGCPPFRDTGHGWPGAARRPPPIWFRGGRSCSRGRWRCRPGA